MKLDTQTSTSVDFVYINNFSNLVEYKWKNNDTVYLVEHVSEELLEKLKNKSYSVGRTLNKIQKNYTVHKSGYNIIIQG